MLYWGATYLFELRISPTYIRCKGSSITHRQSKKGGQTGNCIKICRLRRAGK
jgi:hypothetical protein